jgi:hypothetical protein
LFSLHDGFYGLEQFVSSFGLKNVTARALAEKIFGQIR